MPPTVRDAAFDVLRGHGLTTLFANPGSTEIELLSDLPGDLRFVLGLHESSVVGMATGFALGRREPALAILHTTPGLGNAVSAIATARVNRVPLVVLVGQQDRRHIASEPFLTGRLQGLAGDYPVWVDQPLQAQSVPASIARAYHEAVTGRGPALVIVPMDDWAAEATPAEEQAAPRQVVRAAGAVDPAVVAQLAELVERSSLPALVAGAGIDDADAWAAVVALAERLSCPVWQESFSGRAGFPQDHRLFAGHLGADRPRLRQALEPYDLVIAVGAPAFRQYAFSPGPFVEPGTTVVVISQDAAEVHRSTADLAVLAPPGAMCSALAGAVAVRQTAPPEPFERPEPPEPPGPAPRSAPGTSSPRSPIGWRTTRSSSRSRRPTVRSCSRACRRGSRSGCSAPPWVASGFALPAATGIRMACPDRPVVAFVGDGSSLYSIQSLWSAAHYGAGALFVILSNGGYAVMDRLSEQHGGTAPWPSFGVDVAGLARAFGCPARTLATHDELIATLDEVVPALAGRNEPLLLEVVIQPDETFAP